MKRDETRAGTPLLEMSAGEYRDFLDREVRRRLGTSAQEFPAAKPPARPIPAIRMSERSRRCSPSAKSTILPLRSVRSARHATVLARTLGFGGGCRINPRPLDRSTTADLTDLV